MIRIRLFSRFPSPVLRVQFHPRFEREILVCPMRHAAIVVYLPEQVSYSVNLLFGQILSL
jgi:hypothetical protein